jgi:hypothetical protein
MSALYIKELAPNGKLQKEEKNKIYARIYMRTY